MKKSDIQVLLRKGIAAAKAGQEDRLPQDKPLRKRVYRINIAKADQREKAREILLRVIQLDERNIQAWLWLSTVVENLPDKRLCLEKVLALDPNHKAAKAGLDRLAQQAKRLPLIPSEKSVANETRPAPADEVQAHCPFCEQSVTITATYCHHCSLPLVIDCPACGTRTDVEQATCLQCDQTLGDYRQGAAYFAGLATVYQEHQHYDKVLMAWQAVEALNPDYPYIQLRLGEAQAAAGKTDAAIASLRRVLDRNPGQPAASVALGKIYHDLHRWQEAQTIYRQALATAPQSPQVHFALGSLLMDGGKIEHALPHFRAVVEHDPKNGPAWYHLGRLYEELNKPRDAVSAYQQAIVLLPDHTIASKNASKRLEILNPNLPRIMAAGWFELTRQVTGPILICVLAALLDAGLRPWWIPLTGWAALFLAMLGTILWASGTSLPHNPIIRTVVGDQGVTSSEARIALALFGAIFWLFALAAILLPLGQSFPEMPQ